MTGSSAGERSSRRGDYASDVHPGMPRGDVDRERVVAGKGTSCNHTKCGRAAPAGSDQTAADGLGARCPAATRPRLPVHPLPLPLGVGGAFPRRVPGDRGAAARFAALSAARVRLLPLAVAAEFDVLVGHGRAGEETRCGEELLRPLRAEPCPTEVRRDRCWALSCRWGGHASQGPRVEVGGGTCDRPTAARGRFGPTAATH